MRNQRLCVLVFQLSKLVWPPVVLGDANRFMTGAEQIVHKEFNALFRREEIPLVFHVAAEHVGPLVVDSWDVVDVQLDTGNGGPPYDDPNEATQRMCSEDVLRYLRARTAGDLPWILPAGTTSRSLETQTACRASTTSRCSRTYLRAWASAAADPSCGKSRMEDCRGARRTVRFQASSVPQDDAEARNDFWSISGNYIHRHHDESGVHIFVPKEESFPIPLTYIAVTKATHTNLDVLQETRVTDY